MVAVRTTSLVIVLDVPVVPAVPCVPQSISRTNPVRALPWTCSPLFGGHNALSRAWRPFWRPSGRSSRSRCEVETEIQRPRTQGNQENGGPYPRIYSRQGLFRQIPNSVDLNQVLSCGQQLFDARPTPDDEVFEGRVATIAASDPDNLRWRSTALQDLNEVVVFGNDHSSRLASLLENLRILGSEKTKLRNVHRSALTKVT